MPGSPGANWTATFIAPDGLNPRIDRVCGLVRDSILDTSGQFDGKFQVVPGTPTATASLTNLLGVAAVPVNTILLANVLVANGASSIVDAQIDTVGDGFKRIRPRARSGDVQCQISRTGTQSLATSGTAAAIIWDTEDFDQDGMWAVGAATQIFARTPGYYDIRVICRFAANATGTRQLEIKDEAGTVLGKGAVPAATTDETAVHCSVGPLLLGTTATTRYFTVEAMQRSAGALNIAHARVWASLRKAA